MAVLQRPIVIVSDVHFSHGGKPDTGAALAELVQRSPGAEIVLNGDIFNLSLDEAAREPAESVLAMLAPERALREALRRHLGAGAPLTILPGNHDAGLAFPATRAALLDWLELGQDAPLDVPAWFIRRGGLHIEHGHAYDPDNAPTHPLVVPSAGTEPLGVALTRRFLAPNRAFDFAHATEITPLAALKRAKQAFGARMPLVLARYFMTAGRFCGEARFRRAHAAELREGEAALSSLAESVGVDIEKLRALLEDRPRPTHESFERAFFRLYFDRVFSVLTIAGGTGLGLAMGGVAPFGFAALAGLYLHRSVTKSTNRYGGLPVLRLREASRQVRDFTGAETVVFGHTHVPESEPGYLNPGSFTYRAGPGRPYAYVTEDGQAETRKL